MKRHVTLALALTVLGGADRAMAGDRPTTERMTLEEKVGQLFVANVYGDGRHARP